MANWQNILHRNETKQIKRRTYNGAALFINTEHKELKMT